MAKNIIICCDGTGNSVERDVTNVLRLYRVLDKSAKSNQVVYYDPGLGTLGNKQPWYKISRTFKSSFYGLTGANLDSTVLKAYQFLIDTYEDGDQIYLFGYSRGAYTVKVLAAFIHLVGLLKLEQKHLCDHAFGAYRKSSEKSDYTIGERFQRVIGTRNEIPIKFLGLWDSVSSVLIPVLYGVEMQKLMYTDENPGVRVFRQALAIEETRRMFRVDPWKYEQQYKPNPYKIVPDTQQDSKQVWFSGSHSDVGGGWPEEENGLSKISLGWMIKEAEQAGLKINKSFYKHIVMGHSKKNSKYKYIAPDPCAVLHDKMPWPYVFPIEFFPKRAKLKEWAERKVKFGFYIPASEPRVIPDGAFIHQSVIDRMDTIPDYTPINMPKKYEVVL